MSTGATVALVLGGVVVLGGGGYVIYRVTRPRVGGTLGDARAQVAQMATTAGPAVAARAPSPASPQGLQSQAWGLVGQGVNQYLPGLGGTAVNVGKKVVGKAASTVKSIAKKFAFW